MSLKPAIPALMIGWTLCGVALAEPPNHVAKKLDLAAAQIKRLAVSADEQVVVGASGNGKLVALDMETWQSDVASPCVVLSAAVAVDAEVGHIAYAGCSDGFVRAFDWDGRTLTPHKDDEGANQLWQIAQNPLIGLWLGGDGRLYGLAEAGGDALRLHDLDPATGDRDQFAQPVEMYKRDFREGAIVGNEAPSAGLIYVAHGGNDFSSVQLSTGTTTALFGQTINLEIDDLTPAPLSSGVAQGVYIADPDKGWYQWTGSLATAGVLTPFTPIDVSLQNLHAMVVTYDATRTTVEAVVMQVGDRIEAYQSAQVPVGTPFDVAFRVVDMVAGPHGYVIAGTNEGQLAVLTSRPWIDEVTVDPVTTVTGATVNVSFRADTSGDWTIMRGGTRTTNGVELASGTLAGAGVVNASFVVDEEFEEGTTDLWIKFTDDDTLAGHLRTALTVDNPPLRVSLDAQNVGFSDSALIVEFRLLDLPDIGHYDIYLSTTPYVRADWPTGGPTSTEAEGVLSPRAVTTPESGGTLKTRVDGLDNYVTYYIAVRAVDADGTEGPMSNVIPGTPRPVLTSAEVSGEEGGPAGCANAGAVGLAGGLIGLLALRRRRAALLVGLVVGASSAIVGGEAQAQEEQRRGLARFDRDITPAWASFEFRHDFQQLKQDALKEAYAPWVSVLRLEVGPQIFRVLEVDFGLGFMTRKGYLLDDSLTLSGDQSRMQWMPLSFGGTLRLHILDDQPIVPYGGAGIDWVFWREDELDTEGIADKTARLTGSKNGWHWTVGGNILLDVLSPSRAARLEALTGINDTWLTVEYRKQEVGASSTGFDFSGWALSIGLKVDY